MSHLYRNKNEFDIKKKSQFSGDAIKKQKLCIVSAMRYIYIGYVVRGQAHSGALTSVKGGQVLLLKY